MALPEANTGETRDGASREATEARRESREEKGGAAGAVRVLTSFKLNRVEIDSRPYFFISGTARNKLMLLQLYILMDFCYTRLFTFANCPERISRNKEVTA